MRHYFVTIVLRASGNLKVAQALARHSNISTTSLYAHLADEELDKVYWETFESSWSLSQVVHQLFGTEQAVAHIFEDKQQLFQGVRLSLRPKTVRRESGGAPPCSPTQKWSQMDIELELHYRADPGGEAFTIEDTRSSRGVNLGPARPKGYRGGGDPTPPAGDATLYAGTTGSSCSATSCADTPFPACPTHPGEIQDGARSLMSSATLKTW
jgi:hypothetical protein